MAPRNFADRTDRDLLQRSRRGDRDAFAELWRRHSGAGLTVARGLGARDADDAVAESFAAIYRLVLEGNGPRDSFRAYLFTCIRNQVAAAARASRESADDALDELPHPATLADSAELDHDLTAAALAFHALPEHWQQVIWLTEVEGLAPQQVAPRIGKSANTTAALAYRAREALRQGWIAAHLQPAEDPDCRWARERAGTWVRGRLGVRERARFDRHVAGCGDCPSALAEARAAAARLDGNAAPAVLGAAVLGAAIVGGGAAAAATTGAATPAVPAAVWHGATGAQLGGSVAGAATGGAGAAMSTPVVFGAGTAIVAALVAGFVGFSAAGAGDRSGPPLADVPAIVQPTPTEAPTAAEKPAGSTPPVDDVPDEPAEIDEPVGPTDSEAPPSAAPDATPSGPAVEPGEGAGGTDPVSTGPGATGPGDGSGDGSGSGGGSGDGSGGGSLAPTDPAEVPSTAPEIDVVDTADGLAQPVVCGRGEPGAYLEFLLDGVLVATTTAGADGSWRVELADVGAGEHELVVRQTVRGDDPVETRTTLTLDAPAVEVERRHGIIVDVRVSGRPGADVRVRFGSWRSFDLALDGQGRARLLGLDLPSHPVTLTLAYVADGRSGAVVTVRAGDR